MAIALLRMRTAFGCLADKQATAKASSELPRWAKVSDGNGSVRARLLGMHAIIESIARPSVLPMQL